MTSITTELFDSENLALEGVEVPVWLARPYQLVSPLDMEQFRVTLFFLMTSIISREYTNTVYGKDLPAVNNDVLLEQHKSSALETLGIVIRRCEEIGLDFTAAYVQRVKEDLGERFTFARFEQVLGEIHIHVENELNTHLFMQIPNDRKDFYEHRKLFGNKVHKNFRSTRNDVKEAGSCYAAGRYTACVFHCMRVLEKGLHALVHELNNSFQTTIVFNKQVEFINWGTIIDKIEAEIRELLKPTRQPRLAPSDLQFYSEAAKEFVYFKNAWRDDVSHSRSEYDEPSARGVLNHVSAFMRHLAKRLKD